MINFSKTILLLVLLAVFIISAGFFAYQWWQVKGELVKQIEQNENLIKQIDELQKEIKGLKTVEGKPDRKKEITITTDKIEYKQGEKVKIIIRNNNDEKNFVFGEGYCSLMLQERKNSKWIDIDALYPRCCPCGAVCEMPDCIYLSPGEKYEIEWDQIIDWCKDDIKMKRNALGEYRFILLYTEQKGKCEYESIRTCCALDYFNIEAEKKKAYSNPFIVK
jgi:hypothetical protein